MSGPSERGGRLVSERVSAPRAAYTLVELLAVVVILALIAGLGIPALARTAGGDGLDGAVSRLSASDRRWRELAADGPIRVALFASGWSATHQGQAQPFETVGLGADLDIEWADSLGAPLGSYQIDPRGRSRDLQVTLRSGRHVRRMELLGLTGEWDTAAGPTRRSP